MSGFITNNTNSFLTPEILQPGVSSPLQLSGLAAWYSADKGITLNGSTVSGWADQSGTGDSNKNLSQGTGTKQPTYNASDPAYNNRPTLSFAHASSQFMQSGTWSSALSAPITAFIVANGDPAIGSGFLGDQSVKLFELLSINNSNDVYLYGGAFLVSLTTLTINPRVIAGVMNGASSAIYVSAKTAKNTGDTGSGGIGQLFVGLEGAGGSSYLQGKIAEVIIYNRALLASEIAQVLVYCGSKYSISIGA